MKRRNFVQLSGLGAGALLVPGTMLGNNIPVEALLEPGMDVLVKKRMADVALNAAKSMGATYADARIGRYLNQYVFTREDKVQNVVNTESFGIGIRVIANGTWGFASTNNVTEDGIKKATAQAVAIAKAERKRFESLRIMNAFSFSFYLNSQANVTRFGTTCEGMIDDPRTRRGIYTWSDALQPCVDQVPHPSYSR